MFVILVIWSSISINQACRGQFPTCLLSLRCCRSSNSNVMPVLCRSLPITLTAGSVDDKSTALLLPTVKRGYHFALITFVSCLSFVFSLETVQHVVGVLIGWPSLHWQRMRNGHRPAFHDPRFTNVIYHLLHSEYKKHFILLTWGNQHVLRSL